VEEEREERIDFQNGGLAMASAGGWQSVLGNLLDAVSHDQDRFELELLLQRDTDGHLFKDLLPDDALNHLNNEYLDYWWANTDTPQGAAWIGHGWRVLRADADVLMITFARLL